MKTLYFKIIAKTHVVFHAVCFNALSTGFNAFIKKIEAGDISFNEALYQFDYFRPLVDFNKNNSDFVCDFMLLESLCEFHVANQNLSNIKRILDSCDQLISLSEVYFISIDDMGILSSDVFKQNLLEDLSVYKSKLETEQQIRLSRDVENSLETLLDTVFWMNGSIKGTLNALPVCMPGISESAKQTVRIFYNALFPNHSEAIPLESQFLHVVLSLSGVQISPDCLSLFFPKQTNRDTLMNKMIDLPEPIFSVLGKLRDLVDSRISATSDIDQERWRVAKFRVDEIVDELCQHSISDAHVENVVKSLESFYKQWQDTCSVGVDLQAVDLKFKIYEILGSIKDRGSAHEQEILHNQLFPAIQFRLQQGLCKILPEEFALDVHHINLYMRFIYLQHGMAVPISLKDPYKTGMADTVIRYASDIVAYFTNPVWMFESLTSIYQNTRQIDTSLGEAQVQLGSLIRVNSDAGVFNQISHMAFIESTMRMHPKWVLGAIQSNPDHIRLLHAPLEGHGILGVAARAGNDKVFKAVLGLDLDFSIVSIDRDCAGYTLLDYAVLGGNVSIATQLFDALAWDELLVALNQGDQEERTPTILALASDSRNPLMITTVAKYLRSEQINEMLCATDCRGNTPLMHAAVTGKSCMLDSIYTLNPEFVYSGLETRNVDGKTALILSVSDAKSSEAVQWLLSHGADPNVRILNVDGQLGYSVFALALWGGDGAVVSMLLADTRTQLDPQVLRLTPNNIIKEILDTLSFECTRKILFNNMFLLERIVEVFPNSVVSILSKTDKNGSSIAHFCVAQDMIGFTNVLLKLPFDQIKPVLLLKNNFHVPLFETLVLRYEFIFKNILQKQFHKHALELLSFEGPSGVVVHVLAKQQPFILRDILRSFTFDFARQALDLKQQGVAVEKYLEKYQAPLLKDILLYFPDYLNSSPNSVVELPMQDALQVAEAQKNSCVVS